MKEEIEKTEALEMKELGFNELCSKFYSNTPGIDNDEIFRFRGMEEDIRKNYSHFFGSNEIILAPLYQQVFRWFRDNYGYDISIKKQTKTVYQFIIESKDNEDHYHFIDFPFKNYEEAEIACLKKLIEIIKNK